MIVHLEMCVRQLVTFQCNRSLKKKRKESLLTFSRQSRNECINRTIRTWISKWRNRWKSVTVDWR